MRTNIILFLAIIFTSSFAQYSGGNGTADSPFKIASLNDLVTMGSDVTNFDKYFIQIQDIDASSSKSLNSGAGFRPIGSDLFQFKGVFDGNNFTISGLFIARYLVSHQGLFGYTSNAVLKNIQLTNVDFLGGSYTGGVVGRMTGNLSEISNCTVAGRIESSGENSGGVVGGNDGSGLIQNCNSSATMVSGVSVGGVIGLTKGPIKSCSFTGQIIACLGCRFIGGVVGAKNGAFEANDCSSTGKITGGGYYIGGLIGLSLNGGAIKNSFATGDVSGCTVCNGPGAGGLIGSNSGPVTNCYATGNVIGQRQVGGLIGVNTGEISNCYATGSVTPSGSFVGGLIGDNAGRVTSSYSSGNISAAAILGGLIGINAGVVSNCYSTGIVTGNTFGDNIGGFVGENKSEISACYSTGAVNGNKINTGGFVGFQSTGKIVNSYSLGNVSGKDNVGGFAGENRTTISYCFSKGSVSGQTQTGSGIGLNSGTVTGLYYNSELSGQLAIVGFGFNTGITGLSTNQMTSGSARANLTGFDFCQWWAETSSYPILIWQNPSLSSGVSNPTVNNVGLCAGQTATPLNATALPDHTLLWYGTSATGGTSTTTAPTPVSQSTGTTDYYVSQKNNITGCESSRSKITVIVESRPANPGVTNFALCQGTGNFTLTATPTAGNSLLWYGTNPSGGEANNSATSISLATAGTTDYYVSQKSLVSGCESDRAKISVQIQEAPAVPAFTNVSYCNGSIPTALQVTPVQGHEIIWYGTNSSGGNGTTTAPVPVTSLNGVTSYYFTHKKLSNNCESDRTELKVTINEKPAAPTAESITFCKNQSSSEIKTSIGEEFSALWYGTAATGGTATEIAPTPSTDKTGETIYYVSKKSKATGCESPRTGILVKVVDIPTLPQASNVSFCQGTVPSALIATASENHELLWYGVSSIGGVATKTPTIPDISKTGVTDYFVAQKSLLSGCESARTKISVTVNPIPDSPVSKNIVTLCVGTPATPLTATATTGNSLLWYAEENSSNSSPNPPVPGTETLGIIYFYVSQKNLITGCESIRSKIQVTTEPLPDLPQIQTPDPICSGTVATPLVVNAASGNSLLWYGLESVGGTASPNPTVPATNTAGTFTYYVSQKNNLTSCESPRAKIPVQVLKSPDKPNITSGNLTAEQVTLNSSSLEGNQWLLNNVEIQGETNQSLKTGIEGTYSVVVTANGCSTKSDDFRLVITSINDFNGYPEIFPNPAKDVAHVKIPIWWSMSRQVGKGHLIRYDLYDLKGQLLRSGLSDSDEFIIENLNFPAGTYILKVYVQDKFFYARIYFI